MDDEELIKLAGYTIRPHGHDLHGRPTWALRGPGFDSNQVLSVDRTYSYLVSFAVHDMRKKAREQR